MLFVADIASFPAVYYSLLVFLLFMVLLAVAGLPFFLLVSFLLLASLLLLQSLLLLVAYRVGVPL
jgi:hypothetical protein